MATRLRYNNISGSSITFTDGSTTTGTFNVAPGFPTISTGVSSTAGGIFTIELDYQVNWD